MTLEQRLDGSGEGEEYSTKEDVARDISGRSKRVFAQEMLRHGIVDLLQGDGWWDKRTCTPNGSRYGSQFEEEMKTMNTLSICLRYVKEAYLASYSGLFANMVARLEAEKTVREGV